MIEEITGEEKTQDIECEMESSNKKDNLILEIENLKEKLQKTESTTKEYYSYIQRLSADFDNYKR